MEMKSDDETSNTKTIQENDIGDDKHDDSDKFGNSSSNQPERYKVEKNAIDISNKSNDDVNMEDISLNINSNSDNSKDNRFLNTIKNESKGTYDTSINNTQTENIFVDTSEDDNKSFTVKSENNDTIDKLLSSNEEKDTTLTFSKSESKDDIEKSLTNDLNKYTTLNKRQIEDNNGVEISLSSNMDKHTIFNDNKTDDNDTIEKSLDSNKGKHNDAADQSFDSSKESEVENVDAIKKFIEDQEKEIQIQEKVAQAQKHISLHNKVTSEAELNEPENRVACVMVNNELVAPLQQQSESLTIASNLMDIVLNQSEAEIDSKMNIKDSIKDSFPTEEKGNSGLALKIGSEIEARHFDEYWYPAKIVEVDYEEMEVLIHYENVSKKHDEWISVSSPRLRPLDSLNRSVKSDVEASPKLTPIDLNKTNETCKVDTYDQINVKEEPADEKSKLLFVVGERCLARWRDNRRFLATIQKDLGDGQYEIMFDDGFHWTCSASRLYKYKESMGRNADPLIIGPSSFPSSSNLSPTNNSSPSSNTVISNISKIPPYHKHLFDPTRDYLGSKSERREMKRKLNIKEIFNIGQKRRKVETMPTAAYKSEKSKKPNIIKKKVTDTVNKLEIKREIPDAVASIIGTINTCDEETPYKKMKMKVKEKLNIDEMDVCNDIKDKQQNETKISEFVIKKELDPIEEEKELERFEVQDEDKHVEVIDKIKEVIIKLEDVINKDKKLDSSTVLSDQKANTPIDKNMESVSTGDNNDDVLLCPPSVLKEDTRLESFKNLKNDTEDNLDTENNMAKVELESSTGIVDEPTIKKSDSVEIKPVTNNSNDSEKIRKKLWKIKKGKKLRLLQEKKVKKQVEKVKSELEEMKKQMEQMKKEMILKTAELANRHQSGEMPESFLLPGEWCCKWVNGQPLGTVSEVEMEIKMDTNNKPVLPRRSVQVEDKRLPPGWTKHMVRRSFGNSAGKWDVVLVSPENRRLHTRSEMRNYLEHTQDESLKEYEYALNDFGVHLKLARRMGWVTNTPDGAVEEPVSRIPFSSSPIVKRPFISPRKTKLGLKKRVIKVNTKKKFIRPAIKSDDSTAVTSNIDKTQSSTSLMMDASPTETLEDGYVFVGSLKVQVIDNLLRCPAEGCFKNFRNNTLIKMHIKHYHRDLIKMLGTTPKVLDLAYARTVPNKTKPTKHKSESESRIIKVKLPKITKREDTKHDVKDISSELQMTLHAIQEHIPIPVNDLESPKPLSSLLNRPVKRPRVLLPVRRPDPTEEVTTAVKEDSDIEQKEASNSTSESIEPLDFETAISTHTVTRPAQEFKKKSVKHRSFASFSRRPMSEEDEWCGMNSDIEIRSSYPRSGTPDSKILDIKGDGLNHPPSSESNEEQKEHMYTFTETGERIKIVHMKREEIINCHCGVREEDGLMVQCELCLCWQHALCHNIHKESEVPEKYTCSICLNPRRGRRSARFVHDQDRLYEGLLPGAKPCETLRRSHELSGNLLRIQDALHALRVKYYVATKKNHPKLYLWAKDWENGELNLIQEKLNSDYSDLNIMISDIGKENLPVKPEELKDMPSDIRSSPLELQDNDGERYSQREGQIGSQSLLCGLLSSPGGASLDLPISATDLETLAKSVPERIEVGGPQPEAAIENSACRERLLRHIQRCQAIIDSRLDSIEAQVAELESQDPLFEDDETADYFPRTKQTVQMLLRDLETMEELGIIT